MNFATFLITNFEEQLRVSAVDFGNKDVISLMPKA